MCYLVTIEGIGFHAESSFVKATSKQAILNEHQDPYSTILEIIKVRIK